MFQRVNSADGSAGLWDALTVKESCDWECQRCNNTRRGMRYFSEIRKQVHCGKCLPYLKSVNQPFKYKIPKDRPDLLKIFIFQVKRLRRKFQGDETIKPHAFKKDGFACLWVPDVRVSEDHVEYLKDFDELMDSLLRNGDKYNIS